MVLAAGARLGPYEIVSALGAGGMGEVYRDRDTRLDRIVAVKVSLAVKPDYSAMCSSSLRMQAAMSLTHSEIATEIGPG